MVLLLSALFALPLTAQTTRKYQPPQAGEMAKLRDSSTPELRGVRGGKTSSEAVLNAGERAQLEMLAKAFPQEWALLCELRAGRVHVHVSWWDTWGWYLIVPGVSSTCVAILLLLLFLLLW